VDQSSDSSEQNAVTALARQLGRSRWGQLLGAIVVALLFSGLAYLAWNLRDLTAFIATFALLFYGAEKTWQLLPIPARVRAWWKRVDSPAGPIYNFLWWSGFMIVTHFWKTGFATWPDRSDLIYVLVSIVMIGSIVLSLRLARNTASRKRSDI